MNENIFLSEINFLIDKSIHEMDTLLLTNQYNLFLEQNKLPTISKSKIEELKKNIMYTIKRIQRKIKNIIRQFISAVEEENLKSYIERVKQKYNIYSGPGADELEIKINGPVVTKSDIFIIIDRVKDILQNIENACYDDIEKINTDVSIDEYVQFIFSRYVFSRFDTVDNNVSTKLNNMQKQQLIEDELLYTPRKKFTQHSVYTSDALEILLDLNGMKNKLFSIERMSDHSLHMMLNDIKKYQITDLSKKDNLKKYNMIYRCIMEGMRMISLVVSIAIKSFNQKKAFAKAVINAAISIKKSKKDPNYHTGNAPDYIEDWEDEEEDLDNEYGIEEEYIMHNEIDFLNEDDLILEEEELDLDLEACKAKKESKDICEKCGKTLEKCECAKNK